MTEETAKIRVKLGTLEIDYEGKADFVGAPLLEIAEKLMGLYKATGGAIKLPAASPQEEDPSNDNAEIDGHSTSTFATLIGAKSGSELAKAASAHLTFTQKKERFSRKEILAKMKSAPSFYADSYSGNLTKILNHLVKSDVLRHMGGDTYALSNKGKLEFEQKLAA